MNKCTCGSSMCINIGESIQGGIFRWYVSYHCNNCGKNIEMDGSGVESIPKDMRSRVCSIEQDKSGKISIYFDTYFGHGERK